MNLLTVTLVQPRYLPGWCSQSASTPPTRLPTHKERKGSEASAPADSKSIACCVTRYCGT